MELLRVEEEIAVPVEQAWMVLNDFGGAARWSPAIASCDLEGEGIGAIRTVNYPDGRSVRERLDDIDPARYYLKYSLISGGLMRLSGSFSTITLREVSPERTSVEWVHIADIDSISPELARYIEGLSARTASRIAELENCAPTWQ